MKYLKDIFPSLHNIIKFAPLPLQKRCARVSNAFVIQRPPNGEMEQYPHVKATAKGMNRDCMHLHTAQAPADIKYCAKKPLNLQLELAKVE